ncbi:hypothetical protein BpHYR1_040091 [Brachionus plicatilis]|uniref:Uncharacterized protein n=1 Tax=Brachionus plicatilis TaxID=10195 RepID=A0A3M7S4Q7_BRAPC|nr:hypothetical protein BpHYR1_040091 [Brachionus plicatilis]
MNFAENFFLSIFSIFKAYKDMLLNFKSILGIKEKMKIRRTSSNFSLFVDTGLNFFSNLKKKYGFKNSHKILSDAINDLTQSFHISPKGRNIFKDEQSFDNLLWCNFMNNKN